MAAVGRGAYLPRERRHGVADHGVTMLPAGHAYSAIRITERIVLAAAQLAVPDPEYAADDTYAKAAARLRSKLDGPVVHDPRSKRYYLLVPACAPWLLPDRDTERLGRGAYIGIPRPDRTEYESPAYWAVPPRDPGRLCRAADVIRLVADGREWLAYAKWFDHGRSCPKCTPTSRCAKDRRLHSEYQVVRRVAQEQRAQARKTES